MFIAPNCNPYTGIRYGVIAMNSIDPDVANELWYGPGATNVSHEVALKEAEAEFTREWEVAHEEAEIAANEIDSHMPEEDFHRFIEAYLDDRGFSPDLDAYLERKMEWLELDIDEPVISGEYQGVSYLITWLGGAPLLTVTDGPIGLAHELCSPCVPGAANLDGGWETEEFDAGYVCYVIPRTWLFEQEA